ncbi:transcriptional regulatory protein [Rubellimicrobium mesophilum DSM 19309]|uniref:Transcriptional regulatory protein n=1 Tax=Rubellimicrobium mesophilum DSM 19309 TaxID=442562 RepID=A0A017HPJ3_9RHOB|nr:helix-turn-helix transcriptional regulator [Rubellimicrobium mesophilum]EYD76422.1 transcriptional regulatory protein [Rubellimicrobium mesophilum DSM 19309]
MIRLARGRIGEAIAHAALDPDAWQGVTDAIVEAFPGARAAVVGHDATVVRNIPAVHSGYPLEFETSYRDYYGRIVPNLHRWAELPLGHVAHVWEIMSEEELLASEYYNDWLKPQGDPRHAALAVLHRDPGRMFLFTAQVEQRLVDQALLPVMRMSREIYPLLCHALEINRMMLGLRIDASVLRLGLEPDGAAVLLLGAQGGILYANALAEAMLTHGRPISHDHLGRLHFADAEGSVRLGAALDPRHGGRGAAFWIKGPRWPYEVRLMRITAESLAKIRLPVLLRTPAPQLLVVLRSTQSPKDDLERVMSRLGLTHAEAEVALAITNGATTAEVAEARGISVYTVREQVKSALGKTGSRRQVDLVRLMEALRHVH